MSESARAGNPQPHRAGHAQYEFDEIEAVCLRVATELEFPHHVAHYTEGVWDLTVERIGLRPPSGGTGRAIGPDRRRLAVELFGRGAFHTLRELGRAVEGLRSGPLIRTVIDSGRGAVLAYDINTVSYLVATVFDAADTDPMDARMSRAVAEIRGLASLSDRNAGGYASLPPRLLHRGDDGAAPRWEQHGPRDAHVDRFRQVADGVVRSADLHYLARFTEAGSFTSVDVLDASTLARFFTAIDSEQRRNGYRKLADRVPRTGRRLDIEIRPVLGQALVRVVADVEQGALYFCRAAPTEYLMGVTLDQHRVLDADRRFRQVASDFLAGRR